jgi:hypothetical protein
MGRNTSIEASAVRLLASGKQWFRAIPNAQDAVS